MRSNPRHRPKAKPPSLPAQRKIVTHVTHVTRFSCAFTKTCIINKPRRARFIKAAVECQSSGHGAPYPARRDQADEHRFFCKGAYLRKPSMSAPRVTDSTRPHRYSSGKRCKASPVSGHWPLNTHTTPANGIAMTFLLIRMCERLISLRINDIRRT